MPDSSLQTCQHRTCTRTWGGGGGRNEIEMGRDLGPLAHFHPLHTALKMSLVSLSSFALPPSTTHGDPGDRTPWRLTQALSGTLATRNSELDFHEAGSSSRGGSVSSRYTTRANTNHGNKAKTNGNIAQYSLWLVIDSSRGRGCTSERSYCTTWIAEAMSKNFTSVLRVEQPEKEAEERLGVSTQDNTASLQPHPLSPSQLTYQFDHIYTDTDGGSELYRASVREVVEGTLLGYHGAVILFGIKGSGQSNLALSPSTGLIQKAALHICRCMRKSKESSSQHATNLVVLCSYVLVVDEDVHDLLSDDRDPSQPSPVRIEGGAVVGATTHEVRSAAKVQSLIKRGTENELKVLARYGRLPEQGLHHGVFSLSVEYAQFGSIKAPVSGNLTFVMVGAAEPLTSSAVYETQPGQYAPSVASIFGFASVVNVLSADTCGDLSQSMQGGRLLCADFERFSLVRLLKEALGGNCKTLLVALVPSSYPTGQRSEVSEVLNLSSRARTIQNQPNKRIFAEKALMTAYMKELHKKYGGIQEAVPADEQKPSEKYIRMHTYTHTAYKIYIYDSIERMIIALCILPCMQILNSITSHAHTSPPSRLLFTLLPPHVSCSHFSSLTSHAHTSPPHVSCPPLTSHAHTSPPSRLLLTLLPPHVSCPPLTSHAHTSPPSRLMSPPHVSCSHFSPLTSHAHTSPPHISCSHFSPLTSHAHTSPPSRLMLTLLPPHVSCSHFSPLTSHAHTSPLTSLAHTSPPSRLLLTLLPPHVSCPPPHVSCSHFSPLTSLAHTSPPHVSCPPLTSHAHTSPPSRLMLTLLPPHVSCSHFSPLTSHAHTSPPSRLMLTLLPPHVSCSHFSPLTSHAHTSPPSRLMLTLLPPHVSCSHFSPLTSHAHTSPPSRLMLTLLPPHVSCSHFSPLTSHAHTSPPSRLLFTLLPLTSLVHTSPPSHLMLTLLPLTSHAPPHVSCSHFSPLTSLVHTSPPSHLMLTFLPLTSHAPPPSRLLLTLLPSRLLLTLLPPHVSCSHFSPSFQILLSRTVEMAASALAAAAAECGSDEEEDDDEGNHQPPALTIVTRASVPPSIPSFPPLPPSLLSLLPFLSLLPLLPPSLLSLLPSPSSPSLPSSSPLLPLS